MRLNRLLQLLVDNRHAFTPIEQRIVRASDEQGDTTTIYLYDPIVGDRATAEWWGGVCPQDFVPALRGIDTPRIDLRMNCPGGDVFGAEAMCQALREHPAQITAHIEGLAASAATSITCACDEVLISPSSKFMIHETWTFAIGNKRDMAATRDLLALCDDSMLQEYQRRTGQDLAQLVRWVEDETWFNAEDAVRYGFADAIKEPTKKASAKASAWNLTAYANAYRPSSVQTSAQPPAPAPAPAPAPEPAFASADHRARQQQRLQIAGATRFV